MTRTHLRVCVQQYLGAVLARRLIHERMKVNEARLVRLNPNVTFKTRGNAAIALDVTGDIDTAFDVACTTVEELPIFPARIPIRA